MNEENFSKSKMCDKSKTFLYQLHPNFISSRKLSDNKYQVQYTPKNYGCKTPIIEGFFTLDNAKYWYLNFIYNFMYKCLDMSKIHFIEGDTDSAYWAIAGDPNDDVKQGFKHVISDKKFYDENVYKFLPSTPDMKFETPLERKKFDKKLGGLEIEKQCDSMIALAPKMYTCVSNSVEEIRAKGVSNAIKEKELSSSDYVNTINNKSIKSGYIDQLQLHNGTMSKISLSKNFLTAVHTKYFVSDDFSTCLPLFLNSIN
jgi:hypothetical protein